jgi:glc operon protein GlcG
VAQSEFQAGSHLGNFGSINNREGTQMKMIWRACGLLGGLILFGSTAMAIETKPTLTLDLAKKMAAGCEAKAKQENWKMNIAVVNDGTNLIYFQHMDGAFLGSIYISQQKAITAANFPFPTRFIGELAFGKEGKPGDLPGIAHVPGVIAFPGGLPIMTGSKAQIGAIGVSGGTADQDEECAKAGLEAAADDLK